MRDGAELHDDFRDALGQTFSRTQIERDACPSPVGNVRPERDEGFRPALVIAQFFKIPRNGTARGCTGTILTAHGQLVGALCVDRGEGLQYLEFFIPDAVRIHRLRRFHRNEA